jgi:hypothetical protein
MLPTEPDPLAPAEDESVLSRVCDCEEAGVRVDEAPVWEDCEDCEEGLVADGLVVEPVAPEDVEPDDVAFWADKLRGIEAAIATTRRLRILEFMFEQGLRFHEEGFLRIRAHEVRRNRNLHRD